VAVGRFLTISGSFIRISETRITAAKQKKRTRSSTGTSRATESGKPYTVVPSGRVSSTSFVLVGLTMSVLTLEKMMLPRPNPPMTIPETRPNFLGKSYQPIWTGTM
jgi:hypothetical protein